MIKRLLIGITAVGLVGIAGLIALVTPERDEEDLHLNPHDWWDEKFRDGVPRSLST